jgi:hypothetical protein
MLSQKEKKKEYNRKYFESEQGKKINTFCDWRRIGIIFHDWDLLYKIYLEATKCDFCKCILNTGLYKTKKCLDHDHEITDDENVRGILCFNCNINDVLNPNKPLRKDNTSGHKNIRYNKQMNRWRFSKTINKERFFKDFKTKTEALQFKIDYLNQIEQ